MIATERVPQALERAGFGPVREAEARHSAALGVGPLPEVAPREPKQVAELLRFCAGERLACVPVGGGTELFLGGAPGRVDFLLSTAGLSGVVEYAPADLTLTARAGTTLGVLSETVARNLHEVPLEPAGGEWASLGGILAAASDGPRRLGWGAARDQVLGIAVAHPDGTVARAGGRVVKNVTGYDLPRLHTGAQGTLGVILEATIRLRPKARASKAAGIAFHELDGAAAFLRALRSGPFRPTALDLLDPQAAQAVFAKEFGAGWLVLARMDGEEAGVEAEGTRLRALASEKAGRVVPLSPPHRALLSDPRRIARGRPALWLRASTVPSMVPTFLERIHREAEGRPLAALARAGIGTVHVLAGEEFPRSEILAAVGAARATARGLGGSLLVVDAPPDLRRGLPLWGEAPGGIAVMRRLRGLFDPEGVLSPGRFVEGP
ncbi:MAG TPA: FAD-binding oxidoreductase [Planctomycetota bacterium]|jgi:glycolate oxidase FAD binding subunit|nr:FAD-binding oxidoreductase [Planctomycetota bacterium]